MPCNLAVTITKALVLPEHLQQLLTRDIVTSVFESFLKQHTLYQNRHIQVTKHNNGAVSVRIAFGEISIFYSEGTLTVRNVRSEELAEQLHEELQTLLSRAADQLFAAQVQQSLKTKFGRVRTNSATVDNQGTPQQVTVFSLEM